MYYMNIMIYYSSIKRTIHAYDNVDKSQNNYAEKNKS
jgi:hypothetical protein